MILILESRRAKIDKADFGIEQNLPLVGLTRDCVGGGWDLAVVCKRLIIVLAEEDILWF